MSISCIISCLRTSNRLIRASLFAFGNFGEDWIVLYAIRNLSHARINFLVRLGLDRLCYSQDFLRVSKCSRDLRKEALALK